MKNAAVLSLIALVLGACASTPTPLPDPLSASAQLYVEKCGACHSVPHPQRNTVDEWRHLLSVMDQRIEEKGMSPLSAQHRKGIQDYLDRYAR